MKNKLPIYDRKLFAGVEFIDFWNLEKHPLFFKLNKKEKPFIHVDEIYFEDSIKTDSLQAIANFLRQHDWVFEKRYVESITRYIQASINIPFT